MIRLSVEAGVARIALDRAAARNALPTTGWLELARVVAQVPANARAVLLASDVPGIFCAGADLRDLARLADDVPARASFRTAMRDGIEALASLPMPVIAGVEGGCHGAGVAVALACDLIVAGPAAHFAIPPARLGIGYPAQDVARLSARVGRGQAARLLFTAETINADEALPIGLVDVIGDPAQIAAAIATNDGEALRLLKRMLVDPRDPAHDGAFEDSFGSPRFAAGTDRYRKA
ncbi:Enoyl-CoA hydratase/carnithine racemase [Sphingomonas palmae]|uniref:Enoyl-CoA hydratase/carnithine racemase n=2 Tax=Sphingomonas palmae TaxID=1855283 RepID=A0A1H7FRQ9_9SPHN|nr:Enoyl-CoA hydratase/carnithine racemase [Sphingomonas palmae]